MDYAEEQRQLWNGAAGHAWAASQAVLNRLFKPLADRLADSAAARRPDQLLNVGKLRRFTVKHFVRPVQQIVQ